jgi:hypothetical protein
MRNFHSPFVGDETYSLLKNMRPFARKQLTKEMRTFNYQFNTANCVHCRDAAILKPAKCTVHCFIASFTSFRLVPPSGTSFSGSAFLHLLAGSRQAPACQQMQKTFGALPEDDVPEGENVGVK